MPDIIRASPNQPSTLRDQIDSDNALREYKNKNYAGVLGTMAAAYRQNLTYETGISLGNSFNPDPSWHLDETNIVPLTHRLDPDMWSAFAHVKSGEEAAALRNRLMDTMNDRAITASAGFGGQAAMVLASIADPLTLMSGIATGGIGALAVKGATAGKAAMALRGAAVGFASGIGPAALRQTVSPTATNADIARDLALGTVLGGFGAAGRELSRTARFIGAGTLGAATSGIIDVADTALSDDEEDKALGWSVGQAFLMFGTMAAFHGTVKPIEINGESQSPTTRVPANVQEMNIKTAQMGQKMITEVAQSINRRQPGKIPLQLPEGHLSLAPDAPTTLTNNPTVKVPQGAIPIRDKVRNYARSLLDAGKFDETSVDEIASTLGVNKGKVEGWTQPVVEFYRKTQEELRTSGPLFDTPPKEPLATTADQADANLPLNMLATLDDVVESAKSAATPELRSPRQIDDSAITPYGSVPDGARLSKEAAASIAENSPVEMQSSLPPTPSDDAAIAKYANTGAASEGLNIPALPEPQRPWKVMTENNILITPSAQTRGKVQATRFVVNSKGRLIPAGHDEYATVAEALVANPPRDELFNLTRNANDDMYKAVDRYEERTGNKGFSKYVYHSERRPFGPAHHLRNRGELIDVDGRRGVFFTDKPLTLAEMRSNELKPVYGESVLNMAEQWAVEKGLSIVKPNDKLSLDQRLTQKIEEIRARRKAPNPGMRHNVPGSRAGAAIGVGDIMDVAYEAALRAIRAGVRGTEAIAQHIADIIKTKGENAPQYEAKKADIARHALKFATITDETALKQAYYDAVTVPPDDTVKSNLKPTDFTLNIGDSPSIMVNLKNVVDPSGGPGARMNVGASRLSMAGTLSASKNPLIRWVSNAIGQDMLPKKNGLGIFSLSEWINSRKKSLFSQAAGQYDTTYSNYVKAAKKSGKPAVSEAAFFELPTNIIRGYDVAGMDPIAVPFARESIKTWESARSEASDMALRHGVDGAKHYDVPGYVHRIWSSKEVNGAINAHGIDEVTSALTNAIYEKNFGPAPDQLIETKDPMGVARSLARAIIRHAQRNPAESTFIMGDVLSRENVAHMSDTLRSEGVPSDVIDSIVFRLTNDKADTGRTKPFKARIDMDEAYTHKTATGASINVGDLMVKDIRHLHEHFTNHMLTASGLQRVHYQFSRKLAGLNQTSMDEYAALPTHLIVDDIIAKIRSNHEGVVDPAMTSDLDVLKDMMNLGAQIPTRKTTTLSRALSTLRQLTTASKLATVPSSVQQLTDASEALAFGGTRIFLNRITGIPSLFAKLADGRFRETIMRDIQAAGLAVDNDFSRVRPMIDADTGGFSGPMDDTLGKAQRAAGTFSRYSLFMFRYANEINRRFASVQIIDKFHDMAMGRSDMSSERISDAGFTPDQWKAVAEDMKTNATEESGWLGKKTTSLNLEKWNPENANRFHNALNRVYNIAMSETNATALSRWMTTDIGSLMVQLRKYAITTHESKTLRGIHFKDRQAMVSLMTNVLMNVLVRAGAVVYAAAGRPDQDEYIRKNLDPVTLVHQGFARSAFAGLLPMAVDTVAMDILGRKAIYSGSRPSGIEGGILANPTLDWYKGARNALESLQAPAFSDYSYSQDNVRNLRKMLWVPDFFGLHRAIDYTSRFIGLPQQSKPMFEGK